MLGALLCVCVVLGHLAPVHRSVCSVRCVAFAVSCATWLEFTGVLARLIVLRVRCARPIGFCSLVCSLGALRCVCSVLGHLAPVHRCVRSACCVASAVSWATWLLFSGVYVRGAVLLVLSPGPIGSCTPVCPLSVLCCLCGVVGQMAPLYKCVHSVCCVAYTVCWATWLLFSGVLPCPVLLGARYPRPPDSCSPVCLLGVLRCVSRVQFPGPISSCSPVCAPGVLWCVCGLSLQGAHLCMWMAAFRSRQAPGPVRTLVLILPIQDWRRRKWKN